MTVFIYDGSFEGLLTCVYEAYRRGVQPEIASADKYQEGLFAPPLVLNANPDQAGRVVQKLQNISWKILSVVQYCYLSDYPRKEMLVWGYIRRALQYGRSVDRRYADPAVFDALECMRAVAREAHRFKGFLRFQELTDGSWYAGCEPDHCIVPLVAGHCRERFPEQDWIVHDVRRDLAAVCRQKVVAIYNRTELEELQEHLSAGEKRYQTLWKTFFKHISIAERKNPKLQRQFMPQKYWKYLIEKSR